MLPDNLKCRIVEKYMLITIPINDTRIVPITLRFLTLKDSPPH